MDLDERLFFCRVAGVEDMANLLLEKCDGERVGRLWAQQFIMC